MENSKYMIFGVLILFVFLVGYIIYYYYFQSVLRKGKSYLSKDLTNPNFIFEENGIQAEECLEKCQKDFLCHGLTYDSSQNKCIGIQNGIIRPDSSYMMAWEKDLSQETINTSQENVIAITNTFKTISYRELPNIPFIGQYTISCWINISDWYFNYGKWRCIMYQGSEVSESQMPLELNNWTDVVATIPQQMFGIWLAPFTNNIRICCGNLINIKNRPSFNHPYEEDQVSLEDKKYGDVAQPHRYELEYIDIKDISVNKNTMISLVSYPTNMEIYMDGLLRKSVNWKGQSQRLDGKLYVKIPKSFQGTLSNIKYMGRSLKNKEIKDIYNLESK